MGCVLVELLTDGRHVAFNLSQGIDYTRMDERVANNYLQKLLSVCPEDFRKLLSIMVRKYLIAPHSCLRMLKIDNKAFVKWENKNRKTYRKCYNRRVDLSIGAFRVTVIFELCR